MQLDVVFEFLNANIFHGTLTLIFPNLSTNSNHTSSFELFNWKSTFRSTWNWTFLYEELKSTELKNFSLAHTRAARHFT